MTTLSHPTGLPAKRPATRLAGPYGHPFHPILVTIPIGAWVLSFVLDIASRVVDDGDALGRASWWLIGIGIIGAALAAVFGLMDYTTIPAGTKAKRTATTHLILNVVTLLAFAVSFAIRADDAVRETPVGLIVLSAIALTLLGASGWLGGKLSYHYGVRVAAEPDQAEGFVHQS
jgi:uncharacterized membrane protein